MLQLRPKINKIMKRQISHRNMSCLATSDVQIDCWLAYSFIFTDSNHYKIFSVNQKYVCVPGLPVHEHGGLPHAGPRPHLLHLDPDGDRLDAPQHRHGHLPRHGHHRFQARLYNTGYLYITILIYISIGATIWPPLSIPATIYSSEFIMSGKVQWPSQW